MDKIENIKKNQHIVSSFLLRKFKTGNGKYSKELLVRYNKDYIDFSKKNIKYKDNIFSGDSSLFENVSAKDEIFVEDYFYDLTKKFIYSKGDVNYQIYIQDLENMYSVIEKNAGACIKKIEKNILNESFILTTQDSQNLINLLIAFEMKCRKFYDNIDKLRKKEYFRKILSSSNKNLISTYNLIKELESESSKDKLTTLETILLISYLLAMVDYGGDNIKITDSIKQLVLMMNQNWKIGNKHEGYNITIVKNFTDVDFLLGDEPLITLYDKNFMRKVFSNYFDCNQCDDIKIMPITPKLVLLSTKNQIVENNLFEIQKEDIKKINSLEIFNSYRSFVVTDDNIVDDLIDKKFLIKLNDTIFRKQIINKLHQRVFG